MESRPPRLYKRRNRFDRIYIGMTPYGQGVFAKEPMKAHQPVGRVHGQIKPPGYRSEYCMSFREGGLEPDPPYSLVNHSCSPNCELIEWEITNEETGEKIYELWIHTVREIAKDEQLSIDYAWDWQAAIPCLCGAPNCRGWICSLKDLDTCIRERGPGSLKENTQKILCDAHNILCDSQNTTTESGNSIPDENDVKL